jgi:GT2 family glycosyltransferase
MASIIFCLACSTSACIHSIVEVEHDPDDDEDDHVVVVVDDGTTNGDDEALDNDDDDNDGPFDNEERDGKRIPH